MRFSVLGRRKRIALLNRRLFICVLAAFVLLSLSSAAFAFGTGNVTIGGTASIHIEFEPSLLACCDKICDNCYECLVCGECQCPDDGYIYGKDEDEYYEGEKDEGEYDDNDTAYEDGNNDYQDDVDANDETEENGEGYPDVSDPDVSEPDVSDPGIDQNDEPESTETDSGQTSEEYVPATTPGVEQPPNESSPDAVQDSPVDSGSGIDSSNAGSGEPVFGSQDD